MLQTILQHHLGSQVQLAHSSAIAGGCINQALRLTSTDNQHYFLKLNQANLLDMFVAEAEGLNEIRTSQSLRTPKVLGYGVEGQQAYLLLEYLPLQGKANARIAGEQLAQMHRHTAKQFGWFRNNTLGATLQINDYANDWVSFWQKQRLGFQLERARRNGYSGRAYETGLQLVEKCAEFFKDYQPAASLLHGDLWNGNLDYTPEGIPVVFDPAVYYGDRETDLAMTELFGGFGEDFYAAYQAVWPVDKGYTVRKQLYNLYHILNHFNLFGGNYDMQAVTLTARLLAEL